MAKKGAIEDLVGKRFGMWTVLALAEAPFRDADGRSHLTKWKCRCDCGTVKSVAACSLKSGDSPSCGCKTRLVFGKRWVTHGLSKTPEYGIWSNIKSRTTDMKNKSYPDYGGRGICMCDEWLNDFAAFFNYVGFRPSKKHTIDRIDNERGYEPGNVRWAVKITQANNTRRNRRITLYGVTKTLSEWCRDTGVNYKVAHHRLSSGWDELAAITTPVRPMKKPTPKESSHVTA